jgi:hypothetical protein
MEKTDVYVQCKTPEIALLNGGKSEITISSDSSGRAVFNVEATDNASPYDTIRVSAMLASEKNLESIEKSTSNRMTKTALIVAGKADAHKPKTPNSAVSYVDLQGRHIFSGKHFRKNPSRIFMLTSRKNPMLSGKILIAVYQNRE